MLMREKIKFSEADLLPLKGEAGKGLVRDDKQRPRTVCVELSSTQAHEQKEVKQLASNTLASTTELHDTWSTLSAGVGRVEATVEERPGDEDAGAGFRSQSCGMAPSTSSYGKAAFFEKPSFGSVRQRLLNLGIQAASEKHMVEFAEYVIGEFVRLDNFSCTSSQRQELFFRHLITMVCVCVPTKGVTQLFE